MKTYLQSIAKHPGLPIAAACSSFGFIAGLMHGTLSRAFVGLAIMSVFWIPVLITAWTGRNRGTRE
jgi:hypothetical protein